MAKISKVQVTLSYETDVKEAVYYEFDHKDSAWDGEDHVHRKNQEFEYDPIGHVNKRGNHFVLDFKKAHVFKCEIYMYRNQREKKCEDPSTLT